MVIAIQPVFAQTGESGSEEAIEQAHKVIQEPVYEYYYWPEEDLNNFGLSTLGEGKSGSTLGDKSKRTSNVEANEYLKSRKDERQKRKAETQKPEESKRTAGQNGPDEEALAPPESAVPSGKPIYEWRDEDGTLHITNDLGNIPPEYQDQLYESTNEEPGR